MGQQAGEIGIKNLMTGEIFYGPPDAPIPEGYERIDTTGPAPTSLASSPESWLRTGMRAGGGVLGGTAGLLLGGMAGGIGALPGSIVGAGLVGGIGANKARPADFFYQNLMMGTFMLHHACRAKVEQFVAAGAGCGYPEHAPMPLKETDFWSGLPQAESAPYSLAKRLLQIQSLAYHRQYGFVSIIGVPGNVYGPDDNFDLEASHVVPALVRKFVDAQERREKRVVVWGTGRPSRDFVYASDVARGLLLACERYKGPELVNISSGVETTVAELVATLVSITGFEGEVVWDESRPDGQARRCFDMSKAERDLGFRPAVGLREGLERTVDWYRANKVAARLVA